MDYVIGIDICTQSTKALLVDMSDVIVAQHSGACHSDMPKPGWAGLWPNVWLDAVTECIAACASKARERGISRRCA